MVKVLIGKNLIRTTVIVDSNSTIRSVLEDNGFECKSGCFSLSGVTLLEGDFDKTFEDFQVGESCSLLNVLKQDNA